MKHPREIADEMNETYYWLDDVFSIPHFFINCTDRMIRDFYWSTISRIIIYFKYHSKMKSIKSPNRKNLRKFQDEPWIIIFIINASLDSNPFPGFNSIIPISFRSAFSQFCVIQLFDSLHSSWLIRILTHVTFRLRSISDKFLIEFRTLPFERT